MTECKLLLDNYHRCCYIPGSQIEGRILINFNSETKFRNIKLILHGQEDTAWMAAEKQGDVHRQVLKRGHNTFLVSELIVHGTSQDSFSASSSTKLPAGQHVFPFTMTLPFGIPGSYNCEFGSISYRLQAVVDRKMALDYKDELIFIVVTFIDLNHLQEPELLEPTNYSRNKTLYTCCLSQGPIEMDVYLPKRTLVPEETVNISVRVNNSSNKDIERMELKLKQRIFCRVNNPGENRKIIPNNLIYLKEHGLGAHCQHTFTFPVKLPSGNQVPNFILCKLFAVEYYYSITARLPSGHTDLKLKMYPELGNVDIAQQANASLYPPATNIPMPMPQASYNLGFQGDSGMTYKDIGPPPYSVDPPEKY